MKQPILIFDCDGTLLDTFKLIEQTTIKTFEKMLPHIEYTIEEIHAFFGPLLEDSFRKYVQDEDVLTKCVETYREINLALHPQYVRAYDHISEVLKTLKERGFTIVVYSNKTSAFVKWGLEIGKIDNYIDEIIGVDKMLKPKPSPSGLYQIIKKYQVTKALMFGDTVFDIECVNMAKKRYPNVFSIGVTWCQTSAETFKKAGADYVITTPLEIMKVVDEYE